MKKMLDIGAVGSMGTCHYIFMVYEMLCRAAEKLPCSSLILGRPKLWKLAAYYAALAVFLACAGSRGRRWEAEKEGQEEKAERKGKEHIKTWGILFALLAFLLHRSVSGLRVDFIDVGQGDGILLETREQVILVDGGSTQIKKLGEQRLEPLLKSRGIRNIDMVFVSHGDQDHISGITWLLEEDTGIENRPPVSSFSGKRGRRSMKRLESTAEHHGSV